VVSISKLYRRNQILNIFHTFQQYAQLNPVLAGVFGLWSVGVVTFVFRKVPEHIWSLIVAHMTTSLYLDSSENGYSELNFLSFMQWFTGNHYDKWSRTMSMDSADGKSGMHISIGEGFHFFFRNRKLFWLYRKKIEKPGVAKNLYSISLHYFGRNKKIMHDMIEEFVYRSDEDKLGIYDFDEWRWELNKHVQHRTLDTVVINKALKMKMVGVIEQFLKSKDWYTSRGINYKKVILLTGKPGTGKSSLIKALAHHFQKNLCILNLASMSDKLFSRALAAIPDNSFIVMEDIDSSVATKSREDESSNVSNVVSLSNSTLLNILDGINGFTGSVLFATTNYPEKLDPAIMRKGRVDHIFEIPMLESAEIIDYTNLMFPDDKLPYDDFFPILGAQLQDLYIQCHDDFGHFVHSLPR